MQVGAATNVGRIRTNNEDAYWVGDGCFVVCDGMGGQQAGEVAASLAVETIKEYRFLKRDPSRELHEVIIQAHNRILHQSTTNQGLDGMGTTITMGLFVESPHKELFIGHVGDSRAYLLRDGTIQQLTDDHSVVGELVRNGSLSESEAACHPQRHVLMQALGAGSISVEMTSIKIEKEDRVLFCTDGLSGVVDNDTMVTLLRLNDPQAAADALVEKANSLGGPDNITVVVVYF